MSLASSEYVHISVRQARAAALAAGNAGTVREFTQRGPWKVPTIRPTVPAEAPTVAQTSHIQPIPLPQAPASETQARGFVLYVGIDEAKAAASGTSLKAIVDALRGTVKGIAPSAETYAAVALAPKGAAGSDLEVVRTALNDPTVGSRQHTPAPRTAAESRQLPSAGVVIDTARREIHVDGEELNVTYKEFELLHYLVTNPSRTVTREELIETLWADGAAEIPNERTIDVHVRRLRSKLGRYTTIVRTVRGIGYRFDEHPDVSLRLASWEKH